MTNDSVVSAKNIGKYFGSIKAVDDISFDVQKGEVLGFLGPNGAGKSTTMKLITNFVLPDFGQAFVNGYNVVKDPLKARESLGYLPENAPLYDDMSVLDFLGFVAEVRGLSGATKKQNIDRVIELTALEKVIHQQTGTLSKGFKRRVALAQSIIHDPQVLIMDEPTDGLDPNQKFEVRQLIRQMSKDKVIILSTHILEEVDEVCSRAVIIAKGKIVADGTPESLRQKSNVYRAVELSLKKEDDASKIIPLIEQLEGVHKVEASNIKNLIIYPENNAILLEPVIQLCEKNRFTIENISMNPGNLSEVFREITKGQS